MAEENGLSPRILSCDVFDTLLHRDARAEASRVAAIARLSARGLAQVGTERDPRVLLRARQEVQFHAYRALDIGDPTGEVRFVDMMGAMAAILGLGEKDAAILARAEIEVECAQLRPNRRLLAWLAEKAQSGTRVIAVSDTWHTAATIRCLLDRVAPGHPIATVYTSADEGATKRSGALFAPVLRAEGVEAGRVLHIGDDAVADIAMGRRAGLMTRRVARPGWLRLVRRADAVRSRALRGSRR